MKNEPFFSFIEDKELKNELSNTVKDLINERKIIFTQQEVSKHLKCSLTKIKQIENGTCVDFNAIYKYISFLSDKKLVFIF